MTDLRLLIEARNCTIAVEAGVIVAPTGRFDLALRFPDADLRPGLINAHDHLHRNHYGRLGAPPYADACEWGRDVQQRYRREIDAGRALPRREALLRGAWKNLFAGVTTVVHHDAWEAEFERDFPLNVVPLSSADSLGMVPLLGDIDRSGPWSLHLAEGTSQRAGREVEELDEAGMLDRHLLAVHGIGMDAAATGRFRASGAGLVWCPSSNLFLFGRTAPRELLAEGVDVLLGSDSLLTGDGDLLDELRLARSLRLIGDGRLEDAVGRTAERRLGLPEARLEPGERADIVVLARPLLEASARDVELVMVGGMPRVASTAIADQLQGLSGRLMTLNGVTRWTAERAREAA